MTSITARLFAMILLATGFVWLSGMGWIYASSRQELERVLDARLDEATRMVASLMESADVKVTTGVSGVRISQDALQSIGVDFKLACQVWSIDGRLVGKSSEAPMTQLTHVSSGYSNQEIDGTRWRVFAREDRARGIRVLVGDSIAHRERLVRALIWGFAGPGVLVFLILSGLIWFAIRQGLTPLRRLTDTLAARNADELGSIDIGESASEIQPVVDALNRLFEKVVAAREHERSVTAFAAHELRTPLAGLKTQVQIALAAADPAMRDGALRNALVAADRTTRMATQLLALAQIDAADPQTAAREWIDAGQRLRAICDELRSKDHPTPAAIDERLFGCKIKVEPHAFHVAARNLTENALHHGRGGEPVRWTVAQGGGCVRLAIEDDGPGIPSEEIPLVTKRFFRGRNKTAFGSGLGLSIAEAALEKDGLSLNLEPRMPGPGLRAEIVLPEARVKTTTIPCANDTESEAGKLSRPGLRADPLSLP